MITPIEIRQRTFKGKTLGGYDKDDVHAFLNTVSLEWEKMIEEQRRLKTELDKTSSNLDSLKQIESVLHKTLLQAEQTSKSTIENAKKDAELKMNEADARSRDILTSAHKEKSRIEIEIGQLVGYRNEILEQLKLFLQSQTERLKGFESKEIRRMDMHSSASPQPEIQKPIKEEEKSLLETTTEKSSSRIINDIADEL